MHLSECEISTREVRGHPLAIIFGARRVSAEEGAALLSQFGASHGGNPVFASPDGWQILEPAAVAVPTHAEAVEVEKPAAKRRK